MKICTIIGARPQFIKAAVVSRAIREYNLGKRRKAKGESNSPSSLSPSPLAFSPITEVIVHTGQHYDYEMNQVFFDQLDIPKPDYHLGVGSANHGEQTGRMLIGIEEVLLKEKPDWVLVYGDTNSTLAGTLAASKLHIKIAHVEAGLRSFNRKMPEEINRFITDHLSTILFAPTPTAVQNLKNEGITKGVHQVPDVMEESLYYNLPVAQEKSDILERLELIEQAKGQRPMAKGDTESVPLAIRPSPLAPLALRPSLFALVTIHRPENTDDPERLRNIFEALNEISKEMPVILPLHPRTKKAIETAKIPPLCTCPPAVWRKGRLGGIDSETSGLLVIDPVSYIDMLKLESNAKVILTDSGGIQKEAFWLGVPCVTLRDETEWVETVESGFNTIVSANKEKIKAAFDRYKSLSTGAKLSAHRNSKGGAAGKCIEILSLTCQSK